MRFLLIITCGLLLSACEKRKSHATTQSPESKKNTANWQPAKSSQMRETKSRTSDSKSNNRAGRQVGVWEQLRNQPSKDYSFDNMPFHEAVTLFLSEAYGPDSAKNAFRISFEGREDIFQFPISESETLPKELLHKSRWLSEFEVKDSTPTNALQQLCRATDYRCRITSSGFLFEARKTSSTTPFPSGR